MLPYLITIFIPSLLAKFFKNKRLIVFTILVYFTIFIGLRSLTVGADTLNYEFNYSQIYSLSFSEYIANLHTEPLYLLFVKTIGIVSRGNFRFFLLISALIFSIGISYAINNLSSHIGLSWFFIIAFSTLVYGLSGLRSSFGLVFGLISFVFLNKYLKYNKYLNDKDLKNKKKRNLIACICYAIVATLFHFSAIVFLILPFLFFLRKKLRFYYIYYFVVVFALYFIGPLFFNRLAAYFFPTKEYSFTSSGGWGLIIVSSFFRLFIGIFCKNKVKDSKYCLLTFLLEMIIAFQFMALSFNLWSRVSQFLLVCALIVLPNFLYKTIFTYETKQLFTFLICAMFFVYFCSELIANSSQIVPYSFG